MRTTSIHLPHHRLSPSSDTASTESSSTIADHAPRACEKCRASKRRCDKTLPFCTRCTRLNAKCVYLTETISPNTGSTGAPVVIFQPQALTNDALLRSADPLEDVTAQCLVSLISADGHPSEKYDWVDAIHSYFNYVHSWYAVVHQPLFEQRITSLRSAADSPAVQVYSPPLTNTPSDKALSVHHGSSISSAASEHMSRELALLIVAMYLTTRTRFTASGERPMFDQVYRFAKRVLALALAENSVPSLELAQAGALLALYEYGHGDSIAAYRTLSETVAVARVLGVQPGTLEEGSGSAILAVGNMDEEQKSGLWWSLFILDQFLHRDEVSKNLPFILETPEPYVLLPGSARTSPTVAPSPTNAFDVKYLCDPPMPPSRRMSISVPISTQQMESFQLSAKVASLLHRALRHEYDFRIKTPGCLPRVDSFAHLDKEIRSTTFALLQDDVNWQAALDCFAMCVSALFTLYMPFLPVIQSKSAEAIKADYELRTALAALRFAAQISTDISCKLNGDIKGEVESFKYLSAPAAPTCYLAVLTYVRLRDMFPDEWQKCQRDIIDKYESLRFFSYRWGIAEKIMRQLQDTFGLDRNEFLPSDVPSPPLTLDDGEGDAMDLCR